MTDKLKLQIESLLLVATKPLKLSKIKEQINTAKDNDVRRVVDELKEKYNVDDSGLHILENNSVIQLTTNPAAAEIIKNFVKDETTGELTRPSLETLTIIAYRQPISKAELEQIRGVNCSMILRNLMIRGLIMNKEDKRSMTNYYFVTTEFLKFLGINQVNELPDYDKLNNNINLQKLINPDFDEESEEIAGDITDDIDNDSNDVDAEQDNLEDSTELESDVDSEKPLKVNIYS